MSTAALKNLFMRKYDKRIFRLNVKSKKKNKLNL